MAPGEPGIVFMSWAVGWRCACESGVCFLLVCGCWMSRQARAGTANTWQGCGRIGDSWSCAISLLATYLLILLAIIKALI